MKSRAMTHRVVLQVFVLSTLWLTALITSAASTSGTTHYLDVNHPHVADSSDHDSNEVQETATDETLGLAAFPGGEGSGANSVGGRGARVIGVTNTSLPTTTKDILIPRAEAQTAIPAFPGAEGFGANTVGGRGGRVIEVTNLNDSGPGSLRAAVEAEGPRIVVFRVAGTIDLDSRLYIRNPYITIAGQTAPRGGITLRNRSHQNAALTVWTNDVIIRYIRSRPGPGPLDQTSCCLDAFVILGGDVGGYPGAETYNVIFDHVSTSWAVDESICAWWDPHDFTIQWTFIGENLHCSTHSNACSGGGALLLGRENSYNISVHHMLYAWGEGRCPEGSNAGLIDVVNNVTYYSDNSNMVDKWGDRAARVNYVGNYMHDIHDVDPADGYYVAIQGPLPREVFLQNNISSRRPSDDLPEELIMYPEGRQWIVSTRHEAPLVTTYSCNSFGDCEAYRQVLAGAGATVGLDS